MQKFERSIPFIRLGLFFVHSLGLSLTLYPLISSFQPFLDRTIVFGLAIGINILLGAISIRSALPKTRLHTTKGPTRAITAAADASLAIAFLVLHIINVQIAEDYLRVYHTVMLMYGAFCALIACVVHLGLSLAQAHVLLKSWYGGSNTCPACRHYSGLSAEASAKGRSPVSTPTRANEAGMSEGDRLITTVEDE